jgi:hypothetical protein
MKPLHLGGHLIWVPLENNFGGISIFDIHSMGIFSPYSLSCSFLDKDKVCEGIVSRNVRVGQIGEDFGGASTLSLQVHSCIFRFGSRNKDRSISIFFLEMVLEPAIISIPHTNCPWQAIYPFPT